MSQFQWIPDVPAGILRNHSLSDAIYKAAVGESKFMSFVKTIPGFGKHKGDTHSFTKTKALTVPTSAVLSEADDIPVDTFSVTYGYITISEFGRAVPFTSWAEDLTKFDLENSIQGALKDQMKLSLDDVIATAFKTCYLKAIPTSISAIHWETDGTPATAATSNLTVAHCGVIRDYMTDTVHVPFWERENYMGIASTKALRGIKSDPDFMEWRKYLQPGDVLYNSEVGQVEQIRFVECNRTAALANNKGTGSVLGEALIFGKEAVGMVEALTPELRAGIPTDFGRKKAVAWYGELGFGLIWSATATDGEAKVVHVTSS